jgi:hypothetical protein
MTAITIDTEFGNTKCSKCQKRIEHKRLSVVKGEWKGNKSYERYCADCGFEMLVRNALLLKSNKKDFDEVIRKVTLEKI